METINDEIVIHETREAIEYASVKRESTFDELIELFGEDHLVSVLIKEVRKERELLVVAQTEISAAMKVLNPNMPESGIEDAARQVKQVAITAQGIIESLEEELKQLQNRLEQFQRKVQEASHNIEQTLGKVLGYPWHKDDLKNFPDATEADGVCVGDHVAESIALEAAHRIETLKKENNKLKLQLSSQKEDGCIVSVGGLVTDIEQKEIERSQKPKDITDVRLKAVGNLSYLLSMIRCGEQLSGQEVTSIHDLMKELEQNVVFTENKIQHDKDWWSAVAKELEQIPEFCELVKEFEEHEAQLSYQDAIVPFIKQVMKEITRLKNDLEKTEALLHKANNIIRNARDKDQVKGL